MTNPINFPGWPEAFASGLTGVPGLGTGPNPAADLPGMDLLRGLWGGSGPAPGMVVPTLDVAEIDRRIKELKAVQAWLELNLNLLTSTIQGLEVQRNTIAAVQALGGSMGTAAGQLAEALKQALTPAGLATDNAAPATGSQGAAPTGAFAGWPMTAPVNQAAAGGSVVASDPVGFAATLPPGWPQSPAAAADDDGAWGRPDAAPATPPGVGDWLSPAPRDESEAAPAADAADWPAAELGGELAGSAGLHADAVAGPGLGPLLTPIIAPAAPVAPVAPAADPAAAAVPPTQNPAVVAGAANWLGFMQEQFGKIAAAAAGSASATPAAASAAGTVPDTAGWADMPLRTRSAGKAVAGQGVRSRSVAGGKRSATVADSHGKSGSTARRKPRT